MANSQMFWVGDIVETQLSFVVVPLKAKTFKMMTILHSIMLLDRFSQVRLTLLECPEKMLVKGICPHQTHINMQSRIWNSKWKGWKASTYGCRWCITNVMMTGSWHKKSDGCDCQLRLTIEGARGPMVQGRRLSEQERSARNPTLR